MRVGIQRSESTYDLYPPRRGVCIIAIIMPARKFLNVTRESYYVNSSCQPICIGMLCCKMFLIPTREHSTGRKTNTAHKCRQPSVNGSKKAVASRMPAPWLANRSRSDQAEESPPPLLRRLRWTTFAARRLEGISYETFRTWQTEKSVFSLSVVARSSE